MSSEEETNQPEPKCCSKEFIFKCNDDATGIGIVYFANGPMLMSNIFLAASFITLGEREVGCYSEDDEINIPCDKVYGFKPSSLITNTIVISSLLLAFFLPFIGSIVDCTSYRRGTGIWLCIFLTTIQAIQIGTVQSTWFAMLILQAINGFFYRAKQIPLFAYLPEIRKVVSRETMTRYNADFYGANFIGQLSFSILIVGISLVMDFDDVRTAQLGQAVCVLVSGVAYFFGWYYISPRPPIREIPEGQSLFTDGFIQVFRTCRGIWKHYRSSLGCYFLAVIFAECASTAIPNITVTFFSETLNMSGIQIGIASLSVLTCTIPGAYIGSWVSRKWNPKVSMQLDLLAFLIVNTIGFLILRSPKQQMISYFMGGLWGLVLGWLYSTEVAIFSLLMPPGQESELSGFYQYCALILSFLPPLIVTVLNEQDVALNLACLHIDAYIIIALVFYQLMSPWEKCLEATEFNLMKENKEGVSNDA